MADDMTSRDMVDVSGEETGSKIPQDELNRITDDLITAFKTVFDPEIPVDIYALGLIYGIQVNEEQAVDVTMTLTSPMCPVAGSLPPEIQHKIEGKVERASEVKVEVIWDPPWNTDMMSEAAKLELGMM